MFNVFNINNQHENYEFDGKRNEKPKQTRARTNTQTRTLGIVGREWSWRSRRSRNNDTMET